MAIQLWSLLSNWNGLKLHIHKTLSFILLYQKKSNCIKGISRGVSRQGGTINEHGVCNSNGIKTWRVLNKYFLKESGCQNCVQSLPFMYEDLSDEKAILDKR